MVALNVLCLPFNMDYEHHTVLYIIILYNANLWECQCDKVPFVLIMIRSHLSGKDLVGKALKHNWIFI